jgi:Type IV secretion system pilin
MNRRNLLRSAIIAAMTAMMLATAGSAAFAAPKPTDPTEALNAIIGNIRNWVMGILFAIGVLFLTISAVRMMLAGGDPVQVEKAKGALKNALGGFALAILSPILLSILQSLLS